MQLSSASLRIDSFQIAGAELRAPSATIIESSTNVVEAEIALGHHLYHGANDLIQTTDAYSEGLIGPTIRVKPGDKLKVRMKNDIRMNTNLHVHGLHIHGRAPGDSVFIRILPGEYFDYEYDIPDDHMGGLFLYHPRARLADSKPRPRTLRRRLTRPLACGLQTTMARRRSKRQEEQWAWSLLRINQRCSRLRSPA